MARNRVVLVTGASRGIGRFLAEYYLAKGCEVVGCSRKKPDLPHPGYTHYCLDVSQEAEVVPAIREVVKRTKGIDVLVNSAGIASMNHSMLTPMATVERVFKTNTLGTFLFSREVAKSMIKQNYGRIVNLSTVGVPFRLEGECAYIASKAAVEMITRIMAKEFADYNITVNAVGPTPMKTDLTKGVPEAKIAGLLTRQALRRFAAFEDVANVVDFFLKEESGMVTGQVVYLGGVG